MKIYRFEELINIKNPDSEKPTYRPEVLTEEDCAKSLGGMFGLLSAGSGVPYHYHKDRESVLIILSGEAIEIVEGKEYSVKAGDIIFIPAKERHLIYNKSNNEVRFIEFYTQPPLKNDFIAVVSKD